MRVKSVLLIKPHTLEEHSILSLNFANFDNKFPRTLLSAVTS